MIRYVEPGGNSDKYTFVVATNECGTQVGIYFFCLCLPFVFPISNNCHWHCFLCLAISVVFAI